MSKIRPCDEQNIPEIDAIINEAASVYRGVIPADCWHEPYMTRSDLVAEIEAGIEFWGVDDAGALVGIMGIQPVREVTLIRHAYVRSAHQGRGIGSALLRQLAAGVSGPLLVGTWAAAHWAIRFYERYGFALVASETEKNHLLDLYWNIPPRQRDASVVLTRVRESDGS